jgi:pimeloyl-ACP methyl ester carboxylesterase
MSKDTQHNRRSFLGTAAVSIITAEMALRGTAHASVDTPQGSDRRLAPIQQLKAGLLDIGYYEAGPRDGPPVLLLHGFPYSIESYVDVAPRLAARGCRVLVPYLRGHGSTRFLDSGTPRSGQQAAIGVDVIAFMDALYEDVERRLAALPAITVPTITLDGGADGVVPATDGKSTAAKFAGERQHRVIPNVGHNLPQEDPTAFAAAVWELASKTR